MQTSTITQEQLDKMNADREEHIKYFDMIKPASHWKDKINAVIDERDFDKCADACVYFTGTELYISGNARGKGKVRVKAAGYWGGPCN